jgi:hypothetical protein
MVQNVLKNPRITISVGGQAGEFTAEAVRDPEIVASVADKFRKKYGASEVKKYYSKFDVAVIVDLKSRTIYSKNTISEVLNG